jgi:competence protein ComGC
MRGRAVSEMGMKMSGTATRTSTASFYPRSLRAFTLTEMMVSVVVMIILLGITALIYKAANDAMHLNNAQVLVIDDFNALTNQIDTTMENVYTDGYLVIYGYDVGGAKKVVEKTPDGKVVFDFEDDNLPVRSDAICFFATGNFKSLTDPAISANAGWVYLGHAGSINPATYGSSPFDTTSSTNPLVANRWVLSKYLILFTPGVAGVQPNDDYRDNSTLGNNMKLMEAQFAGQAPQWIRNWLFQYWVDDRTTTSFFGTPPEIDFDATPDPVTFPYTLPNTGSFKVEFAMPKSYFNVANPNDEPELYADNKTIVWRNAFELNPDNPNDSSDQAIPFNTAPNPVNADTLTGGRGNDAIAVFGPNDVWPLFIKFTIRKYDDDLTITSDERFLTGSIDKIHTHGGRTLEYVYKLPVKH